MTPSMGTAVPVYQAIQEHIVRRVNITNFGIQHTVMILILVHLSICIRIHLNRQ